MATNAKRFNQLRSNQPINDDVFGAIMNSAGYTEILKSSHGSSHVRFKNPKTGDIISWVYGTQNPVYQRDAAKHLGIPLHAKSKCGKEFASTATPTPDKVEARPEYKNYRDFVIKKFNGFYSAIHKELRFIKIEGFDNIEEIKLALYSIEEEVSQLKQKLKSLSGNTYFSYSFDEDNLYITDHFNNRKMTFTPNNMPIETLNKIIGEIEEKFVLTYSEIIPHAEKLKKDPNTTLIDGDYRDVNGVRLQGYKNSKYNPVTNEDESIIFYITPSGFINIEDVTNSISFALDIRNAERLAYSGITFVQKGELSFELSSFISGEVLKSDIFQEKDFQLDTEEDFKKLQLKKVEFEAKVNDFESRQRQYIKEFHAKDLIARMNNLPNKNINIAFKNWRKVGSNYTINLWCDGEKISLNALTIRHEKGSVHTPTILDRRSTKKLFEFLELFERKVTDPTSKSEPTEKPKLSIFSDLQTSYDRANTPPSSTGFKPNPISALFSGAKPIIK